LVNAVAALGCTFEEMLKDADAVSFGGTKNALLFGEAVVFPNGLPDADFRYQRKQAMQLPSKTRFVAAQFLELLGPLLAQLLYILKAIVLIFLWSPSTLLLPSLHSNTNAEKLCY
ncbi:MAG: hypothetical protein EOP48_28820, partial [Sphingobacteriales bacterium]